MDFNIHELKEIINALEYVKKEHGGHTSLNNALFKAQITLTELEKEIAEYEKELETEDFNAE